MRMIAQMRVRCRNIPLAIQTLILSLTSRGVSKFDIVTHVRDWFDCSQDDAFRIVESVIGVCENEAFK